MVFCVLNFLSTMETIFYGVLRIKLSFYNLNNLLKVLGVKLSFYNGNNLLWDFACSTFFPQWKQSSMEFHVLNFLSTMETIFNGVSRVKLSFYNEKNLLWSFAC